MPRLKMFNEALVDHYCPEKATEAVINPSKWFGVREFIHAYKQKKDFKKALIYVENNLLKFFQNPKLRCHLRNEHLENWIKEIHKIAAKTILAGWGEPSGHYSSLLVFRWEKRTEFAIAFQAILQMPNKRTRRSSVLNLFKEAGFETFASTWLHIISQVEQQKYNVPQSFMASASSPDERILLTIAYARAHNLLTKSESYDVDQVCKIVLPDSIPEKMKQYSAMITAQIKQCDGQIKNVAFLAARAFRDLTKIHPFPNANGRVSTIILNLILVAFGYPSIVLRKYSDLQDEESEYNKVVSTMDDDLKPLVKYVIKKILENKIEVDRGTMESTPAIDDPSFLFSDALFALTKELKQKLNAFIPESSTMPQVQPSNKSLNLYLKTRLNQTANRFGFDMMYVPGYVEYTEEELNTIKTGEMRR